MTEMEYAIPREHAVEAIRRVKAVAERSDLDVPFPIEVRWVASDDAFLSPATGRDTCYIAAHMYAGMPWETYFRAVEDDPRRVRRPPALGQAPLPHRRDAGAALSRLGPVRRCPQALRPGRRVRQRLHGAGAGDLTRRTRSTARQQRLRRYDRRYEGSISTPIDANRFNPLFEPAPDSPPPRKWPTPAGHHQVRDRTSPLDHLLPRRVGKASGCNTTATARPCRVIVISSPRSTLSSTSDRFAWASLDRQPRHVHQRTQAFGVIAAARPSSGRAAVPGGAGAR